MSRSLRKKWKSQISVLTLGLSSTSRGSSSAPQSSMEQSAKTFGGSGSALDAQLEELQVLRQHITAYLLDPEQRNLLLALLSHGSLVGDAISQLAQAILLLLDEQQAQGRSQITMEQPAKPPTSTMGFMHRLLHTKAYLYAARERKLEDLLRDNSMSTVIVTAFVRHVSGDFLRNALESTLTKVRKDIDTELERLKAVGAAENPPNSSTSLEAGEFSVPTSPMTLVSSEGSSYTDSPTTPQTPFATTKLPPRYDTMVLEASEQLLQAILRSESTLPDDLRQLCTVLRKEMETIGGASSAEGDWTIGERVVGTLLFLRFFVPAIAAPETSGIPQGKLAKESRKVFIQSSKLLNGFFSEVDFHTKEPQMAKFLDEHHAQVHNFVRYATGRQEDAGLTKPDQGPNITVEQPSDQRIPSITVAWTDDKETDQKSTHVLVEPSSSTQDLVPPSSLPELEPHLVLFLARSLFRLDKDITDFLLHAREEDRKGVADQWNALKQVLEEYLLLAEAPAEKPHRRVLERLSKFLTTKKFIPRSLRKNKSTSDLLQPAVPKVSSRRPSVDMNEDRPPPNPIPAPLPAGPGMDRRRASWMIGKHFHE